MKKTRKSSRTFQKGETLFILLIIILMIGGGLWFMRDTLYNVYQDYYSYVLFPDSGGSHVQAEKIDQTYWKSVQYPEHGLTLKYPGLWTVSTDKRISQFGIPTSYSEKSVLNIITISYHSGVLIDGYYDQDLFYRLYNLKVSEVFSPEASNFQHLKFILISKGKIASGHPFVIFRQESNNLRPVNQSNQQAYILKGDDLIILTLSNSDEAGKETFKNIVSTASIN